MDCLVEINKYRKQHDALPLRWNAGLQYNAQNWADHLAQNGALENDFEGIEKLNQGEAVAYLSPPEKKCRTFPPKRDCYACRTSIETWYNESKYYNYKTGYSVDGQRQVLHFTQLVWKGTVKVGIATAVSRRYGVITVARFHPRGNIGFVDDYVRNVVPRDPSVKNGNVDGFKTGEGEDPDTDEEETDGIQGGITCRQEKDRRQNHERTNKECWNKYGDELCDFYVREHRGYCNYSRLFMEINCAKSCNFCKKRSPSPTKQERTGEKRDLRWVIRNWGQCHGDLQWRPVLCYDRFNGRNYQVRPRRCAKELGYRPTEYRDCPQ